jgi:hypothetical protein
VFPDPQNALPIPQRPDVDRYRKIAKDLVKACRTASESEDWAEVWSRAWVEALVRFSGITITPSLPVRIESWIEDVAVFARRQMQDRGRKCALADAQLVIARSHGFQSWTRFVRHLESLQLSGSSDARFEAAADAIVTGDLDGLRRLLGEEPGLVRARSRREHGAALLHYVAANGVEGYRQRTPENVVEIAALLMEAGAEVDATAYVYGAKCSALELAATSGHPERAGVLESLLGFLIDRGAAAEPSLVKSCLTNGRLRAAEFLARRLSEGGVTVGIAAAAGLGRLDWLQRYFVADGASAPGLAEPELGDGFLFACQFGRNAAVEFLLSRGVAVGVADARGQTGLHHAAIGGHAGTVRLLLDHHPPLEAVNAFGGTPLGQALWSAAHGGDTDAYLEILEALVSAGAVLPSRHVPVNARIDAWLEIRGSRAEPEWHWFGERPSRESR